MRRFMKRNYNGSDHFGAVINFEEQEVLSDGVESNPCHGKEEGTRFTNALPTSSLIIVAEAMSVDGGHEDAEQAETDTICSSVDDQLRNSLPPDPFKGSTDSRSSDFSGVRNLVRSTVVAPGYMSGEEDTRIIIELPSLMVRPLKTVRGTFQVTSKRINFIADEHISDSCMDDVASTSGQYDQQDKDRSWFISSVHQIYNRRIEPFTTLHIQLQGGKFGDDDHMFSDLIRTWNSVLEDVNDVKELVPEMFYLPEVFTNVNSVDFGTNQLIKKLGSVKLPPWAESPVDFIHKHRKALESDYVSSHLHEWVDLIFGYRQRGKEAVMANNVFPYTTYEGMVDIDKIADPVQRRIAQDEIVNFGQTPSQLLIVPHIRRRPLADMLQLQTIFRNPSGVRSYLLPNPDHSNVPASAMHVSNDCIVVVDANLPAAHVALHHWQPSTPDDIGTPFLFHQGRNAINSSGGAIRRIFKGPASAEDFLFPRAIAFAASAIQTSLTVVVTCDKEVITGGHADNSVKLISPDGARTIETATGHIAPVTCLALSPDNNYFVTGSRDTTVILWRIHRMSSSHWKNTPEPPPSTPRTPSSPVANSSRSRSSRIRTLKTSTKRRIEGPMHVLRGHLGEVTCCSVSSDLGLVVSSSHISGVLLHSLRTGRLVRKLDVGEAHLICLSCQGIILIWNELEKRLSTFTVNGISMVTSVLSPFSGRVSCIEVSQDGHFALIGTSLSSNCTCDDCTAIDEDEDYVIEKPGDDEDVAESKETRLSVHVPSIFFLDLYKLEVIHMVKLREGQDITAVALNADNTTLIASTADKQLIVFTNPSLNSKIADQMLHEGDGLL
uniref:Uncharacterized protein n=1 Tax=Avena sativa TaxID=4498 RepID=A0ACD5ZLJ8_AVESA